MLQIGVDAPDFELPSDEGLDIRLHEQLGRGPVVLYFYPADFSPGCTAQACMMRDRREPLRDAGYQLFGISPQSTRSHEKFARRLKLGFPLLADTDKAVCRLYGVLDPLGIVVRRTTFLVGEDAKICDVIRADLRIGRHKSFVNRLLDVDE